MTLSTAECLTFRNDEYGGVNVNDTNWLLDGATPTEKSLNCSFAMGVDLAAMVDKERL